MKFNERVKFQSMRNKPERSTSYKLTALNDEAGMIDSINNNGILNTSYKLTALNDEAGMIDSINNNGILNYQAQLPVQTEAHV
jgi:hypothetical protein